MQALKKLDFTFIASHINIYLAQNKPVDYKNVLQLALDHFKISQKIDIKQFQNYCKSRIDDFQGVFQIEKIADIELKDGQLAFLVIWLGFPLDRESPDSWVEADELTNELISEFLQQPENLEKMLDINPDHLKSILDNDDCRVFGQILGIWELQARQIEVRQGKVFLMFEREIEVSKQVISSNPELSFFALQNLIK